MREIKFRAWDTKHKKYIWVANLSMSRIFWDYPLWDNDDYYLEQYIWVKDVNWVDIYEWDLVEALSNVYPKDDVVLTSWYRISKWVQEWRNIFRVEYQNNFHSFWFIWNPWYYIHPSIDKRDYLVVWNFREKNFNL